MYGIQRSGLLQYADVREDYPANIASQLLNDEIDIGLVPVAIIPKLTHAEIITSHCIGAVGEVASVGIFSEVPLEEVETLLLDYQSRTSVNLARVLMQEYWQLNPVFQSASADFRDHIAGRTAAVVIGDRALQQRHHSRYYYDLSLAWKAHTGLPFVFAAWVANKPLEEGFIDAFDKANAYGLKHIDEVVSSIEFEHYDLKKYYTEHISYTLDEEKRKGLALFLDKLKALS